MRKFLSIAFLLASTVLSGAQVPLPQDVSRPEIPSGLDATGIFTAKQLQFNELGFASIFGQSTQSTAQNTAQLGLMVFDVPVDLGYRVGNVIYGRCLQDLNSYIMGYVTNIDTSSGTNFLTIDALAAGGGSICSSWSLQVINALSPSIPVSQALALSADTFAVPGVGDTRALTVDKGKAYATGSVVFIDSSLNTASWFFARVIDYNSISGVLDVITIQTSGTGLSWSNWVVWLISPPAPSPIPVYTAAGVQVSNPHAVSDVTTLSGGTKTVTLTGLAAFANANSYIVVATDATGTNPVKAANVSGSSFTLTGTGSDKVNFIALSSNVPTAICAGALNLSLGCALGPFRGL